jgi:hypothetical protein
MTLKVGPIEKMVKHVLLIGQAQLLTHGELFP